MKRKVIWTCVIVGLLLIVVGAAFAYENYHSQIVSTPTSTPESEDGSFVYNGIKLGLTEEADADGDWISDRLEFQEYGTNPLKVDSDSDGVDDFNEIFTYPHLLDPLDPTDDEEFLAMLPDVEAAAWEWNAGGTTETLLTKYVEIAKRDLLVQWYAEHTTIEWQDADHIWGRLKVNGEPLFLEYGALNPFREDDRPVSSLGDLTAYYLTHGRRGFCSDVAIAHYPILELMDYECLLISGQVRGENHAWLEANIDGRIYVVNFNTVKLADIFYQTHNWTIVSKKDL